MREDEKQLLLAVGAGEFVVDAGERLGIARKRVNYLTEIKWPEKRWWDYGVAGVRGWLADEGRAFIETLKGGA